MNILSGLTGPEDLRHLDETELAHLAVEIRHFLVESVCSTGGHLGPNLGVVELTIALHRVFDSPATPIIFDTGHQAYVHKLLTGRQHEFASLRTRGGLSGYPNRSESTHDVIENSHASTALSYAQGLSTAFALAGNDRAVVAVVGDGALTGGGAWEALNNLAVSGRPVVIVLNDNERSYSPTVGGLGHHLQQQRHRGGFAAVVEQLGGSAVSSVADGSNFFTSLGFHYLGPVDGHDFAALEDVFREALRRRAPVVVHCRTVKGRGYSPAENDEVDKLHTVGVVDVATGRAPCSTQTTTDAGRTWSDVFADALLTAGEEHPRLAAISAAMLGPTGLQRFADRFPDRCFDVGIAEQHAVMLAAGMAMAGAHPVVSLYATFANRAFDQLLLDVGLHKLPVTLTLDRAGITGPDGPSHHGIWDLALLGTIPGMRVAAPRDAGTLSEELAEAVVDSSGPTALRFPKSSVGAPIPAVERVDGIDVLAVSGNTDVLLVAVGAMAGAAVAAAREVATAGLGCTVVDPRWVLPVADALLDLVGEHRLVVTVEDGVEGGGVGSRIASRLGSAGIRVPVVALGLPTEFIAHGSRAELLGDRGLDAEGVAASVRAAAERIRPGRPHPATNGAEPLVGLHRTSVANGRAS